MQWGMGVGGITLSLWMEVVALGDILKMDSLILMVKATASWTGKTVILSL
jgi:hypothetical protein